MTSRAMQTIMDKTVATTSYAASGATAAGGFFSLNEVALLLGILFAALTFAINWLYQERKFKHEIALSREKHAADQHYHAVRLERIKVGHIEPYTGPDDKASGN